MVKTITISNSAYEALRMMKRSSTESFSEVILRMTGKKESVRAVAGAWRDKPKEECDSIITSSKKMFDAWDKPAKNI